MWRSFVLALFMAPGLGSMAVAGTIDGSATYLERIAVPQGAVLNVQLLDVSKTDVAAETLVRHSRAIEAVPATFELNFDDTQIKDNHSYVVRAQITQGGQLLFTTDTAYPVLTRGGATSVDLVLVKVKASADASLHGSEWQVVELKGVAPDVPRPLRIAFASGGQFGAFSGCNQLSGTAEIGTGTLVFPDNMAATMMACPPVLEQIERGFVEVLGQVRAYYRDADQLKLLGADGTVLLSLTQAQ
ncbi:MAG: YbaY family lipoprotein [Pseudomonadota bacterium]